MTIVVPGSINRNIKVLGCMDLRLKARGLIIPWRGEELCYWTLCLFVSLDVINVKKVRINKQTLDFAPLISRRSRFAIGFIGDELGGVGKDVAGGVEGKKGKEGEEGEDEEPEDEEGEKGEVGEGKDCGDFGSMACGGFLLTVWLKECMGE